jgi:hypothetical protein
VVLSLSRTCEGPGCVNVIPDRALGRGKGRRRVYCSRACQAKAYRQRVTTPAANEPAGLGIDRAHEFTPLDEDAKGPTGGNLIRPDRMLGSVHKPLRPDQNVGESDSSRWDDGEAPEANFGSSGILDLIDAVDAFNIHNGPARVELVIYRNDTAAPYLLSRGHEYKR